MSVFLKTIIIVFPVLLYYIIIVTEGLRCLCHTSIKKYYNFEENNPNRNLTIGLIFLCFTVILEWYNVSQIINTDQSLIFWVKGITVGNTVLIAAIFGSVLFTEYLKPNESIATFNDIQDDFKSSLIS
ncbi:uncharacterized protein RJT21DRAFT_113652 [Scheffersomyces amazonensis]|uniref:uncharacterized protein n=1 Tax=Scheffersomyces amazonensis TaxID=1078765 RepID=UPI00315CD165